MSFCEVVQLTTEHSLDGRVALAHFVAHLLAARNILCGGQFTHELAKVLVQFAVG